jgi:multiple sugar transport system substrate-binding protein
MAGAGGGVSGLSVLLAACGAAQQAGGGSAASKPPVTLRVNHRTEKYIPEWGKQFTQRYPNVTLEFLPDSGYEKLIALVAAGDLGDVVWASTGVGSYFELAAQGHFLDLDPLAAAEKYNLKQYFPRAIDVARLVDRKLFGLPNLIHPSHIGLFYNVNLFEAAGVKPPTTASTYDDLVDLARKVTAGKQDVWGIATETVFPPLLCYVRSFGGEMLEPPTLGKKPAIDKGPAKQAFQWLYDLRHKHRLHPLPSDTFNFTDGNVAMRTTGMWGSTDAKTIGDRFTMDATLIPKGPGGRRGSQGHVDMWALYARTKHKDAAWQLITWYTSREAAPYVYGEHGIPGARPDGWADTAAKNPPMFTVFKDFMDKEGPDQLAIPWNLRMLDMQNVVAKALEPMWSGEQGVDQTVAAAMGPIQQQLDLPRASGK